MNKENYKQYPNLPENLNIFDLDDNNSLKKMVIFIGENKTVIDFGCASGYLANLLKKQGCRVTGLEINPEAAEIARQYCEEVFVCDLDFDSLNDILGDRKFDVAVFGDILEHLRNPWKVLEQTKDFLNPSGYVVASIPNIAHGAVRLALLEGNFDYMPSGILDDTHLRFFTRKTVEELFEKTGYFIHGIDYTKLPLFEANPLIPCVRRENYDSEVINKLQKDPNQDILQFIIKALPNNFDNKYFVLKETNAVLSQNNEALQYQLQEAESQLQETQSQLSQTQSQLQETQSQLQETQSQLQETQSQLQETQSQLSIDRTTITWMETSKFWKLRKIWVQIKSLLGLDKDNKSQNIRFFLKPLFLKVKSLTTILKTRGFNYVISKVQKYGIYEILRVISSSRPEHNKKSDFLELPWKNLNKGQTQGSKHFKILLISHDATRTGAPIILLMLLKELANQPDFDCWVLLDNGEEMEDEFAEYAPTLNLSKLSTSNIYKDQILHDVLSSFRQFSHSCVAICNTAAISYINKACDENKIPVLAWLHELPTSIETYLGGKSSFDKIIKYSQKIIVVSDFVKSSLTKYYGVNPQLLSTVYAAPAKNLFNIDTERARQKLRQEFNLPNDAFIVLGCGTVDLRKGSDLFVQVAKRVLDASKLTNICFIWIGKSYDNIFLNWLLHDIKVMDMQNNIIFAGSRNDTSIYFTGADLFLLTSREDPFPLVNLEAMSCGLPVIAFEGGGGATEIYANDCGVSVEYLNVDAMVKEILALVKDKERRQEISLNARTFINESLTWNQFSEKIVNIFKTNFNYCPSEKFKISVVVPNYNYSQYIDQRLKTILAQTIKPDEIIFLDDASKDDSLHRAKQIAQKSDIPFKFIENEENSGSPFKQWIKGLGICSGDLIWIAEADDYCDAKFLEKLIPAFFDPDVVLAYSQSAPVSEHNELFAENYLFYTNDISEKRWETPFFNEGITEIQDVLALKNTIPNASAVVFRKPKFFDFTTKLASFRFTGDWFFYVNLLKHGKIAFISETLNFHRRHNETVTNKIEAQDQGIEEILEVKAEIFETTKISLNRISESMARTIYEYYELAIRKQLNRPKFMNNTSFESNINRIQQALNNNHLFTPTGLNILVVIGDAEVGGGQIAGIRLANEFAKTNRVFLCNARPNLYSPHVIGLVDESVVLIEGSLEAIPWSNYQNQALKNPNNLFESELRLQVVRDLIRLHKIDVILSHIWWADRFVYKLNKELELPWFIRMHGCYEGLLENPDWDVEFQKLIHPLIQSSTGICYSTERNIRYFKKYHIDLPKYVKQLFNGFNKDDLHIPVKSKISRQTNDFVFCLCSRAIPEKGWEEAIKSIILINKLPPEQRNHKTARLILIGYSEYAQDLQLRYQDVKEVDFRKEVQYPTEIIAFCDVGLLPTWFISESLPSTIIEYLACGKPTISTNKGSIPEMISLNNKDAGIIIPIESSGKIDIDKLIESMLLYMNNQELFNLHKNNTDYLFTNLFASGKIADSYINFFTSAIKDFC
jgi:glycosyltransferase involved in cell wall biosynthesis/2-polyprenyl-3-methyl-5-hydroxy-6-metoxy-1,4-benzoquinol methylase